MTSTMPRPTPGTRRGDAPVPPGRWWPLTAVCVAVFMLLIDVTVVNVAVPSIQSQLHASFSQLQWVIDAYALTLAALQLTSGTLGDRYGRKSLFATGIAVFTLSSLACGLAPNAATLVAFRAVQGVGGAVMFANSLAIIGENYTGRDRGTAFGVWGAVAGASVALGPLVGGALTTGIDWRWIFFINLPIGALALALTLRRLGPSPLRSQARVDVTGLLLSAAGLTTLVYALIEGNTAGWVSAQILVLFTATAVFFAGFVWVELRSEQPMVDVRLFGRPAFTGAQLAAFAISASLFALFLYLTLYLQDILGYSAFETGLRLLPITAVGLLAAPVAGKLSARVPYRVLIGVGLALLTAAFLLMNGLTANSGWTPLLAGFILAGLGNGLINAPLGSLAVSVVEQHRSGMGAGVNNSFRQVGLATGIGVFGAVFAARVASVLTQQLPALPAGSAARLAAAVSSGALRDALAQLPAAQRAAVLDAAQHAFVSGLNELFLLSAGIAAAGGIGCVLLIRQRDLNPVTARPTPLQTQRASAQLADRGGQAAPQAEPTEVGDGGQTVSNRHFSTGQLALMAAAATGVPPGSGSEIIGTVRRADGSGLPDAVVTLTDPAGRQEVCTATASHGDYRLAVPHGGTYLVVAASGKFQPHAAMVAVTDRSVRHNVTLTGASGVHGVIRTADPAGGSRPVVGVPVTSIDLRGNLAATVISDELGRYRIAGVPDGHYTLAAAARSFQPVAVSVLLLGSATTERDVELSRRARLVGTVVAASSGRGVTEALTTLIGPTGGVVGSTVTEVDGSFAFDDLAEGSYTLLASGYKPMATVVQVTAGGATTIEVALAAPALETEPADGAAVLNGGLPYLTPDDGPIDTASVQ